MPPLVIAEHKPKYEHRPKNKDAEKRMLAFKPTGDNIAKEIIWHLENLTTVGERHERIFEDWLTMCQCQLKYMRRQFDCALNGNQFNYDDDDVKFYEGLHVRYKSWGVPHLYCATELLLKVPEFGFYDILGDIYMDWGWPSRSAGQFFTPISICQMMAKMTNAGDGVNGRLLAAIKQSPIAEALMLAGSIIDDPALAQAHMIYNVIPACIEYYEPIKVNDPACGSGAMFLATAAECEWWHIQLGLIQFYGQDIDRVCCLMADVNMKLYGLNGFWAPMIMTEQANIWRNGDGEVKTAVSHNLGETAVTTSDAVDNVIEKLPDMSNAVQLKLFD